MSDLRRHSGLARLSLAVCGRLTLTGLHQPRPPLRWRLVTALPLCCFFLLVLAAVVNSLLGHHEGIWGVLVAANIYNFLLKTGIVFVTFVTHRDSLRRLQARLEALEHRAAPDAARAGRFVQLNAFIFWLLAISFLVFWIFYERATSHEHEGMYFVNMWTPEPLYHFPGSWVVYGFQLLVLFIGTCFMGTFDSCYFVWMKAATSHLRAIRSTLQGRPHDRPKSDVETGGGVTTMGLVDSQLSLTDGGMLVANGNMTETEKRSSHFAEWRLKLTAGASDSNRVVPYASPFCQATADNTPQDTDGFGDTDMTDVSVATLQEAGQYYDNVTRFVDAINHLTGPPSFVLHASTMMNVLLDGYLLLRLLLQLDGANTVHVLTYSLELCLFVLRLTIYSLGGDEIIRESVALRQALANVPWQRLTPPASRYRAELLLKLQQPLCVEPLGFFTVRKGNLLSMTGLFLTYFVIIIQMVQMTGVDD